MKIKRRKKSSRYPASQTHKRGKKARTRGSGNQGGKGWAGTGKRGDQKKTLVIKLTGGNNYFGKSKTLRRGHVPKKFPIINLDDLSRRLHLLISQGKARESKGKYELDFSGYKLLGGGELSEKINIKVSGASASAEKKIKDAGGEIILPSKDNNEKDSTSSVSSGEKKVDKKPKK